MRLEDLRPAKGSKKRRKIIGRGPGSGHGYSSTKGTKGQHARSGRGPGIAFEGGQMPLVRRIPKRGFTNFLRNEYAVVNVGVLAQKFDPGTEITPTLLAQKNLVKTKLPVKILGEGEVDKILNIKAHAFSKTAQEKITKAGGSITVIK